MNELINRRIHIQWILEKGAELADPAVANYLDHSLVAINQSLLLLGVSNQGHPDK